MLSNFLQFLDRLKGRHERAPEQGRSKEPKPKLATSHFRRSGRRKSGAVRQLNRTAPGQGRGCFRLSRVNWPAGVHDRPVHVSTKPVDIPELSDKPKVGLRVATDGKGKEKVFAESAAVQAARKRAIQESIYK